MRNKGKLENVEPKRNNFFIYRKKDNQIKNEQMFIDYFTFKILNMDGPC